MKFDEAFKAHILNQKIIAWGFQKPTRVLLPDGFFAFPCGYFTEYENGYKMMISGESLGSTAVQEALIVNPTGVPIARDSQDIKEFE